MYRIPDEHFFRIHHVRPRFKNNVENVLIHVAEEIQRIGSTNCSSFRDSLNRSIKRFPGNIGFKRKNN
jgi:DNA-binding ferritin-like protein